MAGQQQVTSVHRGGEAQTVMLLPGAEEAAAGKHLHGRLTTSTRAGSLTFVGLGVGVLDVGRELGENVHSGRVGLGIASGQSRAPGETDGWRKVHT